MAVFYKGAPINSHWYHNDPRSVGLSAIAPHLNATNDRLMQHVARGTRYSPFISLSRSFNVACDFAFMSRIRPTLTNPAFVYEITLDPVPRGVTLLDPVMEVVGPLHSSPHFTGVVPYFHDGSQKFVIGIASHTVLPALSRRLMALPYRQPPPSTGTPRPPNLTIELETIIRALRDTEVLAIGIIPATSITNRFDVYP